MTSQLEAVVSQPREAAAEEEMTVEEEGAAEEEDGEQPAGPARQCEYLTSKTALGLQPTVGCAPSGGARRTWLSRVGRDLCALSAGFACAACWHCLNYHNKWGSGNRYDGQVKRFVQEDGLALKEQNEQGRWDGSDLASSPGFSSRLGAPEHAYILTYWPRRDHLHTCKRCWHVCNNASVCVCANMICTCANTQAEVHWRVL